MNSFKGLNIVSHPLAREVRDEFKVESWPIAKRRKGYRVVKHRIDKPCAYVVGNVIYMHPDLIKQLPPQTWSAL